MSSNLVRNLTYVAVAACFLALMSLIYRSAKENREKKTALEGSAIDGSLSSDARIYEDEGADGGEAANIDTTMTADEEILGPEVTDGKMMPTPRRGTSLEDDLSTTANTVIEDDAAPTTGAKSGSKSVAPRSTTVPKPKPSTAATTTTKAPTTATTTKQPKPMLIAKGGAAFSVVAGAFSTEALAAAHVKTLVAQGFKGAKVVPNGTTFRVSAGTFPSRKDADGAVAKLKVGKISAFVAPLTPAPAAK